MNKRPQDIYQWYCCQCGQSYGSITKGNHKNLDYAKRFDCHRCQHLMCPYCLKTRFKDLGDVSGVIDKMR